MITMLIENATELVTVAGPGPKKGRTQDELGIIPDGAVAADAHGRFRFVGATEAVLRLAEREGIAQDAIVIDASGKAVLPGFVDAHTHLVFAGTREGEYEKRLEGASYLEIAEAGGGILQSVRETRAASSEALFLAARLRMDTMLAYGTTTIEAKTGYGLSTADEMKCLDVARKLAQQHPMDVVSTFLGAHAVPTEYLSRRNAYIDLVMEEMLPLLGRDSDRTVDFCDVFCDEGAFTVEESRRVLLAARERGLGLKIHADEFVSLGAASLAAELGVTSADHLTATSKHDMRLLAEAAVIGVLLPGTSFHLGTGHFAPAREFVASGVPIALATDCNPGTSMTESMQIIIAIACSEMKLRPAEALVAATLNAAYAIGRGKELGSLEPGKKADAIVLSAPSYRHLPYHFGINLVEKVVKNGRLVVGG